MQVRGFARAEAEYLQPPDSTPEEEQAQEQREQVDHMIGELFTDIDWAYGELRPWIDGEKIVGHKILERLAKIKEEAEKLEQMLEGIWE